jgi:hypothetical protein
MLPLEIFRSYIGCAVMLVMFYFVSIVMTSLVGKSLAGTGTQLVYFTPGVGAIYFHSELRQACLPAKRTLAQIPDSYRFLDSSHFSGLDILGKHFCSLSVYG